MSFSLEITLPNGRKYSQPTGLFINNEFMHASGDKIQVLNPAYVSTYRCFRARLTLKYYRTEEEIATLHGASTSDVDKAVASARAAFEGPWSELSATERGAFLYKLAELIDRDRELIASIDAADNGKVCDIKHHLIPSAQGPTLILQRLTQLPSMVILTNHTMSSDTTLEPQTRSLGAPSRLRQRN